MSRQEKTSTTESQELIDSWDRQLKALDDRLRASGRTVTVREASDTEPYVVTFPPARAPKATPKKKP